MLDGVQYVQHAHEARLDLDQAAGQYGRGSCARRMTTTGTVATWWVPVHIRLNADGSLNFDYKGANVFTNFFVPGYQDFVNAGFPVRFGFGARTGGLNANQWIDNLQITTVTQPLVGISQQPFSQTAQQGDDVQFDVRVGNTNGVTFQWYSNNVVILNATNQTLTISNAQAGYSGSQYKVTATGPNNSVTSSVVTLNVTDLAPPGSPQLSFNFDDGAVPAGTAVFGNALVDTSGGVTNSGALKLTIAANNENGAFVVSDPDAGLPVYGFTARFKTLVGGGSVPPADGFAFAFGNDIPADPTAGGPHFEEGGGLGANLQVTFDIYNNDGIFGYYPGDEPQPAPSIDVRFGGQVLGTVQLPISFMETGVNDDGTPALKDTIIQLNTDGTLNVVYHGALVFNHLAIPSFGSIAGGSYVLAGRTGGLNDNIWVDNFQLTTVTTSGPVRITTQPVSQTVLVNHAVTFAVGVNDPTGVTYQWSRGGSPITGATTSSYTIGSTVIGDSGATFAVQVTKGLTTLNSSTATLTVVNLAPPVSPNYSFNFNDGLVPVNTAIYGNSAVTSNGGVSDSGCMHLVDAVNSENGAFVIQPLYGGAQVSSIGVAFDVRVGGGSSPPADGWSFNFANNLPDGTVGGAENGNGNGLSVCMDIYGSLTDNPPAPNFNIRYKGALVSSIQIPYPQLETGLGFSR